MAFELPEENNTAEANCGLIGMLVGYNTLRKAVATLSLVYCHQSDAIAYSISYLCGVVSLNEVFRIVSGALPNF